MRVIHDANYLIHGPEAHDYSVLRSEPFLCNYPKTAVSTRRDLLYKKCRLFVCSFPYLCVFFFKFCLVSAKKKALESNFFSCDDINNFLSFLSWTSCDNVFYFSWFMHRADEFPLLISLRMITIIFSDCSKVLLFRLQMFYSYKSGFFSFLKNSIYNFYFVTTWQIKRNIKTEKPLDSNRISKTRADWA